MKRVANTKHNKDRLEKLKGLASIKGDDKAWIVSLAERLMEQCDSSEREAEKLRDRVLDAVRAMPGVAYINFRVEKNKLLKEVTAADVPPGLDAYDVAIDSE